MIALPYAADGVGLVVAPQGSDGCRVASVIDGDTVTLWCPETGWERTRLLGFDTPEKFSPGCVGEFTAALKAEWALRRAILDATELRVEMGRLDRFERRLASLMLDGQDVANLMIASGHARAYQGGLREGWCT